MLGWLIVASAVLTPLAIVAWMLVTAAREDGWSKTLWDTSALIGIATLAIIVGYVLTKLV